MIKIRIDNEQTDKIDLLLNALIYHSNHLSNSQILYLKVLSLKMNIWLLFSNDYFKAPELTKLNILR
jgi:hypothetical protein